jgi:hypothetical protein
MGAVKERVSDEDDNRIETCRDEGGPGGLAPYGLGDSGPVVNSLGGNIERVERSLKR